MHSKSFVGHKINVFGIVGIQNTDTKARFKQHSKRFQIYFKITEVQYPFADNKVLIEVIYITS